MIAVGWQVHSNFSALDQSRNYYIKNHTESMLSIAPNKSIIFAQVILR